jgi:hypothetical protein
VTDDYKFIHAYPNSQLDETPDRCFKVADAHLNHFELHISKDRAELWASDYDDPSSLKLRTTVPQLDLKFTRGYVHFQHAQYNAAKDGHVTPSQTFRWDNVGFDGPTYPTPRGYDVANNTEVIGNGTRLGWYLDDAKPHTVTVHNVNLTSALSASFNFTVMEPMGQTLEYAFNGKPAHTFVVPERDGSSSQNSIRGFSVDVPLDELVNGDNTITLRVPNPILWEGIGNMDLTVEAP